MFLLLHHVFMYHIIAIHQWLCRVQGDGGGDPTHPRPGVSEYLARPRAGTSTGKKVTPGQPRAAQRAVRVVGPRQRSCEHSDIRQHVTVTTTSNVPDLTSEDSSQGLELSTNLRGV